MKYITQFLIILGFSFAGEAIHSLLPLPIPASVYGIVALFLALELKWVKVNHVREVSTFLIAVMPVMFIPAAVGLIDSWPYIAGHWLAYIAVTIISTFTVMAAAGWITQRMIRQRKEGNQ